MEKLKAVWHKVIESLWFVPGIFTLAAGTLAILLIRYNDEIMAGFDADEVWWLFGGGSDGAKSVLESISGSIMTVTGVVFSVTIIALQLASSQFTPRVLRQFMASRANQSVLGVFIGTFTYTLLVQRTVRSEAAGEEFVPAVAVTGAVILALTSIGFLIFYINHAAHSIRASVIIDSATSDALRALRSLYPVPLDNPYAEQDDAELPQEEKPYHVVARKAGFVQAVDRRALRRLADRHRLTIRVDAEIGTYLLPGQLAMSVWPGGKPDDEAIEGLIDTLVQGPERTPHQDILYGVTELMDIAVKAMSPSLNDPTTAVNAMQRMSEVLLDMAWRERGDEITRDDDGRPLVLFPRPKLADAVRLGFDQVRHYAAGNPTVAVLLLETLADLAALSPDAARAPFLDQLEQVARSARMEIRQEADRQRVERAVSAALARAASPPPVRRPHR
jgi:uncharacterized membrane protein